MAATSLRAPSIRTRLEIPSSVAVCLRSSKYSCSRLKAGAPAITKVAVGKLHNTRAKTRSNSNWPLLGVIRATIPMTGPSSSKCNSVRIFCFAISFGWNSSISIPFGITVTRPRKGSKEPLNGRALASATAIICVLLERKAIARMNGLNGWRGSRSCMCQITRLPRPKVAAVATNPARTLFAWIKSGLMLTTFRRKSRITRPKDLR